MGEEFNIKELSSALAATPFKLKQKRAKSCNPFVMLLMLIE
jgi:hypothetical protein